MLQDHRHGTTAADSVIFNILILLLPSYTYYVVVIPGDTLAEVFNTAPLSLNDADACVVWRHVSMWVHPAHRWLQLLPFPVIVILAAYTVIHCTWLSTVGDRAFPGGFHPGGWKPPPVKSLLPDITSVPTLTVFQKLTAFPGHLLFLVSSSVHHVYTAV